MSIEKKILKSPSLPKLFEKLKESGKIMYAPVKKGSKVEFSVVQSFSEILEDYIVPTQSAKTLIFPRTEKLFAFKNSKKGVDITDFDPNTVPEIIIWGARPCDAAGFAPLSAIFNWDVKDNIYNTRLRKTTLLSFSCNTCDEYCFCTSVKGNPGNTEGSDLLLTKLKDGDYLVEIITEKGTKIATDVADLLANESGQNKEENLADVPVKFDFSEIKGKVDKAFNGKYWLNQSMRCIGCGACAYVCPACACFDIQDEVKGRDGIRQRCWDSCGIGLFTLHTSGHNPREVQSQRWRQRVMHKFSYMPDRIDVYGCLGCGRCSRSCPVDMNISEHLASFK